MNYQISAACGCSTGAIRLNNEDNFYFNGEVLPQDNSALAKPLEQKSYTNEYPVFAVFDGVGGSSHGEAAAFLAAKETERLAGGNRRNDKFIVNACEEANNRVCKEMIARNSGHMGTTAAMLHFSKNKVNVCNIGDSRVYRFSKGSLVQLSVDHVVSATANAEKASLTQFIGIFQHEMSIETHYASQDIATGDVFLICSDGLTDMLSDDEIQDILNDNRNPKQTVESLIGAAMLKGGIDNITVIVCCVQRRIMMKMSYLLALIALLVAIIVGGIICVDSTSLIEVSILADGSIGMLAGESRNFSYAVQPERKRGAIVVVIEDDNIASYNDGRITAHSSGTTKIILADRSGNILDERDITVY